MTASPSGADHVDALCERATGTVVGSTRFGAIDRFNRHVEIGWTWLAPEWWRSRAAIERVGATFEGIFRHHMVTRTERLRDSAYYSIVAPEWPTVKSALRARLDAHGRAAQRPIVYTRPIHSVHSVAGLLPGERRMRALTPVVLSLCMTLPYAAAVPATSGTTTVLECRFDAEPLDTLIGEGGAALGQPITRGGAAAYVRATPFTTPSLEIADSSSTGARLVRFEFLNDWELTTGIVEISMKLVFPALESYVVYVRERQFSSQSFTNIRFDAGGGVAYGDQDTPGSTPIGSYTTGQEIPLVLTFDLDAGTYDISLGGSLFLDDDSIGPVTSGIGAVLIGTSFDTDLDGVFSVDDFVVTATETPSPVESTSWGSVKADWR